MINHVMIGSNDIERSKRFYDAVLGTLGAGAPFRDVGPSGHVRLFYRHDVAVAQGGTSIEDAPGPRTGSLGTMHLAYVRDPDGNKLCAIHRP